MVVHKTGNFYFNSLALSFSSSCLKITPLVIVSSFLSRRGKTGEGLVERGHCKKRFTVLLFCDVAKFKGKVVFLTIKYIIHLFMNLC